MRRLAIVVGLSILLVGCATGQPTGQPNISPIPSVTNGTGGTSGETTGSITLYVRDPAENSSLFAPNMARATCFWSPDGHMLLRVETEPTRNWPNNTELLWVVMVFGPSSRQLVIFHGASKTPDASFYATSDVTPSFGNPFSWKEFFGSANQPPITEKTTAKTDAELSGETMFRNLAPDAAHPNDLMKGLYTDPKVGNALAGWSAWRCAAPHSQVYATDTSISLGTPAP